jgi:rubrerythrin
MGYDVINMSTKNNLMAGFAGESQANRKYAAFSEKAAEEGFNKVATLFKAASRAEEIHARRHLQVYGIPSTLENLKAAIEGETEEFTHMYPGFIKESQAEGNEDATRSFTYAMKAEQVHAGLYEKALAAVKDGKDLDISKIFLCLVCGIVVFDSVPSACPICGVPGKKYEEIVL